MAEHLANKFLILDCLRHAFRVLRPGGTLLAIGPNIRFCYHTYWDFFDHYVALSDRSITEALRLAGFRVVKCIDRFLPFTMAGRLPTHPLLVRAYLACPPLWRVMGQQFFVVARKD